jgi:UDP-N-acetylglucosamine 2-epimerase (non-hydrolysing)
VRIVATGQQPDLFDTALACFGFSADVRLAVAPSAPGEMLGQLVPLLGPHVAGARAVLVQGDTTSALAGALAAAYARRPVVHIEAGLRTGGAEPHPEEMHRTLIAQIASLHFAPTPAAVAALAREGVMNDAVVMTGNSGIDALLWMAERVRGQPVPAALAGVDWRRPVVLVTVHRRENHGAGLAGVMAALTELASDAEIVLPVHPHPAVAGPLTAGLAGVCGVHLTLPLDYPDFVWAMARATLTLTDSGGVQEEAPALGLPVLVMRGATERPEGVASGNARMVGTDAFAIVSEVRGLLAGGVSAMAEPAMPYGAGDASGRMAAAVLARFGPGDRPLV